MSFTRIRIPRRQGRLLYWFGSTVMRCVSLIVYLLAGFHRHSFVSPDFGHAASWLRETKNRVFWEYGNLVGSE
jgi:hypothetical protein